MNELKYRYVLSVLLLLVLAGGPSAPAAEKAPVFCGFRNDGTGVWPADCTPVTTWNETDFHMVDSGQKDKRGTSILKEVPLRENKVNIVWKTPLPMYCNGGMAIAGGRLFMLADPGGIGFAGQVKPDFLGVRLYCLDARDGKQLWTDDLHHIDLLPAGEQEKVRTTLKEIRDFYYEVLGLHLRWQRFWDLGHGNVVEATEENKAAYARIAAEYRKHIPTVPATLEELAKADRLFNSSEYIQCKFAKILMAHRKDIEEKKKFLANSSYRYNDFFGQGAFIEDAFATPVTDGKRIYVTTNYADAYCCDLDGKLIWKQWYKRPTDRMSNLCSPMIYGDLMVLAGSMAPGGGDKKGKATGVWMAVDKNTGKPVWQTPKEGCVNYAHSTPSYHRLLIGGDPTKPLEVLWYPSGQVLRLRDGKQLAADLGCQANARPWAVQGDILVIENGSGDGGPGQAKTFPAGTVAFRLSATDEGTVKAEQLWVKAASDQLARLVARNGVVYGFKRNTELVAVDLLTGKPLKSTLVGLTPTHLSSIAGPNLFAMDSDGRCAVVGLGPDGQPVGKPRINRLGVRKFVAYDFFNQGSQPAFSGNRLFIRSYTDVYCIGDPQQPARLSAVHTGP